ncbi:MAG TPA: HNH endonuclease [Cyclobacteriaceae bacterium]|nr:HNH endonuclease [Cyclobacteriaceae bacterium]
MRTWVEETKQILTTMWGKHSAVEIAEQVNLWHTQNATAKGKSHSPMTTDAGVMYQAAKLGYITPDEAEAYHLQRKKRQARKNYVPKKVRTAVLERDGHRCLLCGASEDLMVNHIVSVKNGGTSEADNLQTLCGPCYRNAKGHTDVDFRQPYEQKWCDHCHRYHYQNIAG